MKTFEKALVVLKQGGKVTRKVWDSEIMNVHTYGRGNKITLWFRVKENFSVPWHPSQEDVLANDWIILEEGNGRGEK